jgi:hypothetical protein
LGGRKEVISSPAVELLKYMDMTLEKERNKTEQEKARMYIQYLSNIFSQTLQEKPSQEFLRAKKEFESLLMPDSKQDTKKKYEWDFDPKLIENQE